MLRGNTSNAVSCLFCYEQSCVLTYTAVSRVLDRPLFACVPVFLRFIDDVCICMQITCYTFCSDNQGSSPDTQGGLMKRISKGWRRSSSQGTASTVTSSGADSRGSARSGGMASIAFTGSSGGRSRHHNLLMETNMAFENGSEGGRTKRSHGAGFFAFSQVTAADYPSAVLMLMSAHAAADCCLCCVAANAC